MMNTGRKLVKVLVGSKNPMKIESVQKGFLTFFEQVEVEGVAVDTGVPEQPVNQETFDGAKNRAEKSQQINEQRNLGATFFVGIEGGTLKFHDRWFVVNVIYILDEHNRGSFGTTGLCELPGAITEGLLVEKGFGRAIRELVMANDKGDTLEQGTIGFLTDGKINRVQNQVQGVIFALIPFIKENLYFTRRNYHVRENDR